MLALARRARSRSGTSALVARAASGKIPAPISRYLWGRSCRPRRRGYWIVPVLVIRSLLFNFLFYLNLLVQIIAALPTLLMARWAIIAVA